MYELAGAGMLHSSNEKVCKINHYLLFLKQMYLENSLTLGVIAAKNMKCRKVPHKVIYGIWQDQNENLKVLHKSP